MKERPILFSGSMVRAILEGRKSQTRRVVKPQPLHGEFAVCKYHKTLVDKKGNTYPSDEDRFGICDVDGEWSIECPYGSAGARLWVRETARATATEEGIDCIHYMADDHCRAIMVSEYGPWRKMRAYGGGHARAVPSIHMPRWASRITLEITGVRVERLNDISEEDAIAEGIESRLVSPDSMTYDVMYKNYLTGNFDQVEQGSYQSLWEMINGTDSRVSNPYVWVIEFKRVQS
jgi:hypothetical protein